MLASDDLQVTPADASPTRREIDHSVLLLREQGRSFSSIARTVGLNRAAEAHRALLRELRRQPDSERQAAISRELQRLDALEARVRDREGEGSDAVSRRVATIGKMRTLLHNRS